MDSGHVIPSQDQAYLQDLDFLSRTAARFLELAPDDDIYQVIADGLRTLSGDAIVVVNSYDHRTNTLVVKKVLGIERVPARLLASLGDSLPGSKMTPTDDAFQALLSGRFHRVEDGLYAVLFGSFPITFCRRVEKTLHLADIYSMGFVWQGQLFGNVVVMNHQGHGPLHLQALEAFVQQSAVALRRHQAEKALDSGEKRLRWLADAVPDVIYRYRTTPEPELEFISSAAFAMSGYTPEELYADPGLLKRIIYEKDWKKIRSSYLSPQKAGETITVRVHHKHGSLVWTEHCFIPFYDHEGRLIGIEGIARDATAARMREREMEAIISVSTAMRGASHRDEMIAILMDQLNTLFGAEGSLAAIYAPHLKAMITVEARGIWSALKDQEIKGKINSQDKVSTHRIAYFSESPEMDPFIPGKEEEQRCFAILPLSAQEQSIGVLAIARREGFTREDQHVLTVVRDLAANAIRRATFHEQTEQRLQRLTTLRAIYTAINSSLDLAVVLDDFLEQVTRSLHFDAAAVLLQSPRSNVLEYAALRGMRLHTSPPLASQDKSGLAWQAIHKGSILALPDLSKAKVDWAHNPLLAGEGVISYYAVPLLAKGEVRGAVELFHRQRLVLDEEDLEFLDTLTNLVTIALENAQLYKALQDQMDTLAKTQDQLIQREKIAAVGELVAGVAHELNNPITSIIGFSQLMHEKTPSEHTRQDLDKIIAQAQQAARIVRGLLDFARQHPPEREPVQINTLLLNTLDLLSYELRAHNTTWEVHLSPDIPDTMADPNQIQQVFVNLINNAWQAIDDLGEKGRLKISTQVGDSIFLGDSNGKGAVIRVAIEDNGPGIPPEIASRIFNPFFTTKPRSKGTGLGLSICYGIISEHGGHIWADKSTAKGACFFLELPVVSNASILPANPRARPSNWLEQREERTANILMIEDEQNLAEILVRVLQRAGYQVDPVADGESGLDRLREGHYDLVICDIHLSGMNGMEFYHQMAGIDLTLARRTVFTTGDMIGPEINSFLQDTGCACLTKPFELSDLLRQVSENLAQTQ